MRTILTVLLVTLLTAPAFAQDPAELRARYDDWYERDAEGRWVLFEEAMVRNPHELATWIVAFGQDDAWRELLWVALVQDGAATQAATLLVEKDAPPWIALEAWRLGRVDSHASGSAKTALTTRAGLFLAWAGAHAADLGEPARKLVAELEGAGHAADPDADVGRYDPPVHPRELVRVLERATTAEPFGDRRRAVEGAVYQHQVRRAIRTLRTMSLVGHDVVDGLVLAALGAEPDVAREALLAFGHLRPDDVPMDVLLSLAADTDRDATVRDAAFLAATYGPPVRVYVFLHEVVRDPRHPNWEAALSRVAERGDGFTLRCLGEIDPRTLSNTRRLQLDAARQTVNVLAAEQLTADVTGAGTGRDPAALLERAAYADLEGSPIAAGLVEWTIEFLRGRPSLDGGPPLPGDAAYVVPTDLADRFAPGELEDRATALRARIAR